MTTSADKSDNDKNPIIVNEFLTFIQNRIDKLDDLTMTQICVSHFTDEEIETGKNILYSNVLHDGARCITRKGEDKKKKNVKDVLKRMKETEPEMHPHFVAKNLDRLPPVTLDHIDVTCLIKKMTCINADMQEIRRNTVSKDELHNILSELRQIKSDLQQRDLTPQCNLTHTVQTYSDNNTINITKRQNCIGAKNKGKPAVRRTPQSNSQPVFEEDSVAAGSAAAASPPPAPRSPPAQRSPPAPRPPRPLSADHRPTAQRLSYRDIAMSQISTVHARPLNDVETRSLINGDDGFTPVVRKKRTKQRNMRGSLEQCARLQVAEPRSSIYISRLQKHILSSDIEAHIKDLGEEAICVEQLKQRTETSFNSFKVVIPTAKLNVFLDKNFWPLHLVYRKYVESNAYRATSKP